MEKQYVFFSHSSKDKDALIAFKNRLCEITCGVINVFMSSDGQSIPFGSNWVHKIDEGLNAAKIMFIFVTPNSILSNWIYFEAGYAYSKGINVIPVGIGVDITILKPPLNLLQGFNINSFECLNNFIAILNREFTTSFSKSFIESDYALLCTNISTNNKFDISSIFSDIEFSIVPNIGDQYEIVDINQLFSNLIVYLQNNKIPYSMSKVLGRDKLISGGILVEKYYGDGSSESRLSVQISPYSFGPSLYIVRSWLLEHYARSTCYLRLHPKKNVNVIFDEVSISSLLYLSRDIFSVIPDKVNKYRFKSLSFSLVRSTYGAEPLLYLSYVIDDLYIDDINDLIDKLVGIRLIKLD